MIQFNLLPDVKQEYIKAVYRRRLVTVGCIILGTVFLLIFVLMFLFVRVNQSRHLSHLDKDISKGVQELKKNEDLDKILTIQNQLASLPELHNKKVITSRVFEYLGQITPTSASVSEVSLDVESKTISIKGTADTLATVNKFVDTIKFTEYKVDGDDSKGGKAFSSVVLESFSIGTPSNGGTGQATYEINLNYDETIFMNTAVDGSAISNSVKLTVPSIITTRSETQKPTDLFQSSPAEQEATNGQ